LRNDKHRLGRKIMQSAFKSALALAVLAAMAAAVRAQAPAPPPPPPDGPRYVVTYIEVKPTAAVEAQKLVRAFREASRKEAGNLRAEALQRIGQLNHFVVLEAWKDQAAVDAHFKAPAAVEFRDKIKAIQNAPIDDRVHFPLSVGPLDLTATAAAVAAVTHVDVIPPQRENGTVFTKQLAEDSRKEAGNMRFEAVTQVNRQNHFTVVEVWKDRKTADTHGMAEHTRAFRDKLAPASGALYDERFYRFMN
jgi:quinol monooxygenase YgiN